MDTIDLQELFDHVAVSVIAQGGPSLDKHHRCVNVGPNGLKCAAAHGLSKLGLSDDVLRTGDPEHIGPRATLWELCDQVAPGSEVFYLLSRIRDAHDDCAGASDWREQFVSRMRGVALSFDLSTDKLDEAAKAAGWTT